MLRKQGFFGLKNIEYSPVNALCNSFRSIKYKFLFDLTEACIIG